MQRFDLNNSLFDSVLVFLFLLGLAACKEEIKPPMAKEQPKNDTLYGEVRVDPYFWLRERDNPEVIAYLKAENEYTEAKMQPTQKLQDRLYHEMLSRIKETDRDVPEKFGNYYYYKRTEEGKQYPIYCRKKGSLQAEEEILLDQNELAEGHDFLKLAVFKVSPNHKLLAYSTDTTGAEMFTLYVKDLTTGKLLREQIPNTSYSTEWANDNKTLFYNTLDEAKRPFKVFKHTLDTDYREDELVHFEEDDSYFLDISKTKSQKYLLLELESTTTTEVWYLNADRPGEKFRIIHPRQHEMEYYVEHHGDRFFILTNDNAKNFKLMQTAVSNPARKNWQEVIPHRKSVKLDKIEAFANHLVVYERENGLEKIGITDFKNGRTYFVDFEEPAYSISTSKNPEYETPILRFKYSSLVTPETVYDYDMNARSKEVKKQQEVLGGYDPAQYQSERIFASAKDGTQIPISLVYKKDLFKKTGSNPLFLYGYGSYGASREASFSSNRLSLLDRGFVYAIAHIRGGGELGRIWYEQGKLLNKKNTFTDFIACAEHLIGERYTSPEKLVIYGGSAGGLLIGAVINMRPELFEAAVAKVPFVDVINTMLDESIPLTVIEYEEWGNPHEKKYYDYMRTYSPYDNVSAQAYPNLLITAGLNDPRVQYWEPAKWTAKLRKLKTDSNLLLLKTNMGAGHSGASGRYDNLKEVAFDYAFVLEVI